MTGEFSGERREVTYVKHDVTVRDGQGWVYMGGYGCVCVCDARIWGNGELVVNACTYVHLSDPMYRGARKERVSVEHTERRPQVRMWMIISCTRRE